MRQLNTDCPMNLNPAENRFMYDIIFVFAVVDRSMDDYTCGICRYAVPGLTIVLFRRIVRRL